jgi:hypothetical protein
MSTVRFETDGPVAIVTIDRPRVRNAVDGPTAALLADAFRRFDADDALAVAVLAGAGGTFCAGADLKGVSEGRGNRVTMDGDGPMGPSRMLLSKPVIAAVEGHAVAGGLELAVWCDLRVAARDAVFGVYCRRWGVPLVDGGTIRLTRVRTSPRHRGGSAGGSGSRTRPALRGSRPCPQRRPTVARRAGRSDRRVRGNPSPPARARAVGWRRTRRLRGGGAVVDPR